MKSSRKKNVSEASAVHKGELRISSTRVLLRSTLSSNRQLSHACAPTATKCFVRASAVIPVELRQPGAGSLVLSKVNTPLKEELPLASLVNMFATPSNAYTHCKEQHSAKALYPKSRQPGAKTLPAKAPSGTISSGFLGT